VPKTGHEINLFYLCRTRISLKVRYPSIHPSVTSLKFISPQNGAPGLAQSRCSINVLLGSKEHSNWKKCSGKLDLKGKSNESNGTLSLGHRGWQRLPIETLTHFYWNKLGSFLITWRMASGTFESLDGMRFIIHGHPKKPKASFLLLTLNQLWSLNFETAGIRLPGSTSVDSICNSLLLFCTQWEAQRFVKCTGVTGTTYLNAPWLFYGQLLRPWKRSPL